MFFLNHLIMTATYAADVLPNGVNCGSGNIFSGRSSRIINGMEVEPNSWNWESCFNLIKFILIVIILMY